MKLYCQYSGVNFSLPHMRSARTTILTVHPVFHMGRNQLYKMYSDWQEGLLDDPTDRRLLALALLNSTGLIEWRHNADPKDDLIQRQLPNIYYTCRWVSGVTLPALKLPHFAITKDTCSLANVGSWMKVWEGIREEFESGYKTTIALEKQQQRESMLQRLINSPGETARFAGLLAQWAFDAADVPYGIRDYWKQILTTKGIGIYSLKKADIDEMIEHFEEYLVDDASIYSNTLLKYVRDIQKQVVTGLGFNISKSPDLVDVVTRGDYTILDDSDVTNTERNNIQRLINAAPSSAPREADYPNKVAYLRAKICWDMAVRAAAAREAAAARLEETVAEQLAADEELNEAEGED